MLIDSHISQLELNLKALLMCERAKSPPSKVVL